MGDLRLGDDALAAFEVQPARVGELDFASGAAEQPQADGSLQFGHLARQGGFGDAKGCRGAAKTMRFRDLDEEFHAL
ncbi:hypothetical protein D3C86_1547350 [compost metagenome]